MHCGAESWSIAVWEAYICQCYKNNVAKPINTPEEFSLLKLNALTWVDNRSTQLLLQ